MIVDFSTVNFSFLDGDVQWSEYISTYSFR